MRFAVFNASITVGGPSIRMIGPEDRSRRGPQMSATPDVDVFVSYNFPITLVKTAGMS